MKKITTPAALGIAFIALGFFACKKNSSDSTTASNTSDNTCMLSNISIDAVPTSTITYNNNGKIASEMYADQGTYTVFNYSYNGNTQTMSCPSDSTTEVWTLNGSGYPVTVIYNTNQAHNSNSDTTTCTYNSDGTLAREILYGYPHNDTTTYTYTNGNLTKTVEGSTTTVCTYYTDKTRPASYIYDLEGQIYGYGKLPKQLMQTVTSTDSQNPHNNYTETHSYTYDSKGNIATETVVSTQNGNSTTTTFGYTYQCK